MDAPALPPSSALSFQSDVPALISVASAPDESAALEPPAEPTLISQSERPTVGTLPMDTLPKSALLGIRALDFSLLQRNEVSSSPVFARTIGWLPSTKLAHSFGFMSRAFRSAKLDSALRFSQFSATVPIQWARSNDWKSWAKTADVQVTPVTTNAQATPTEKNNPSGNAAWAAPFVAQCLVSDERNLSAASPESPLYQLSLKETTLGYVADRDQAYLLAQQLERLIHKAEFEAEKIAPQTVGNAASGHALGGNEASTFRITAADRTLFSIDASMAEAVGYSREWAAIAWANNLRTALDAEPLNVGETQTALKQMAPSGITLKGDASWYGPYFHGRATANGETYNQHDLTVAHKSLPFGTYLKVRNLQNDRTVVVRVNDRGPYVGDRSLDLSNAAAKCLGSEDTGVVPYEAVILNDAN
ncbi:MAG: septal ring lytic transglycosylase RlpA family protein [Phormidesmis sp.]